MCIRISDDVSILRCLQYWNLVWLWIHVLVSRAALICLCIIHQISCHISENLNLYIPLFLLLIILKCYPGDLVFFFLSLSQNGYPFFIYHTCCVRWMNLYIHCTSSINTQWSQMLKHKVVCADVRQGGGYID